MQDIEEAHSQEQLRDFSKESEDVFDEMSNDFFSSPALDSVETSRSKKKFNDLLAKKHKKTRKKSSNLWGYLVIVVIFALGGAYFVSSYLSQKHNKIKPLLRTVVSRKIVKKAPVRVVAPRKIVLATKTSLLDAGSTSLVPDVMDAGASKTPSLIRPKPVVRPVIKRKVVRRRPPVRRKRKLVRRKPKKRKRRIRRKRRRYPARANRLFAKGMKSFMKGKLSSARRSLLRSIRANPTAKAYRMLTLTYIRMKKKRRAKRAFRRFKRYNPKSPLIPMLKQQIKLLK
jgi:uncharacterized membrane protein (UPF0136 family)